MPIFPQLGPEYYDEKDRNILNRMEAFYTNAISINQSYWTEGDIDTRFETGDQTLWNELYGNLPANRRRQFSFNRIRRVINMITGYQRRNRKSTVVIPIENSDEVTADQFTKILYWINQQEGIAETTSDAFHGSCVTGMNLLQVWLDYRSDPVSGNIKVDNRHYNSFLIDPFFRKADLSDCSAIWGRSYFTKREVLSLLPGHEEEIMGMQGQYNSKDGKFQFMPETYSWSQKDLLSYDEFYYRDFRSQRMLIDSETGECTEWRGKDEEMLKLFLKLYPSITLIDQEIPTVRLAIVVQGKVMYDDINPLGIDVYPLVPVFAYYNPQLPYFPQRVQGVVRGLRDAQYLYNRRKVIELDILESQINSGWKYKADALVDPRDIFMTGQGRGLALKKGASMDDVQQIATPNIPPSVFQISESLAKEPMEISGVNEELLGSAMDDKAGILSMLRQGAGLTTLQGLFDQLDYAQKLLGRVILRVVQENFTPGKVKRILGTEPSPQFYNKNFGRYDCAIEEGLNTTTQKQMQFAQLLQLRELGVAIPDDVLLDAATIQNKKELTDRIMSTAQQKSQLEQVQFKSTVEEQQARTKLAQARATADEGLGLERMSRIQENQQLAEERKAEAEKDRATALLDMVKAIKEMETTDLSNITQLVTLAQTLSKGALNEKTIQAP